MGFTLIKNPNIIPLLSIASVGGESSCRLAPERGRPSLSLSFSLGDSQLIHPFNQFLIEQSLGDDPLPPITPLPSLLLNRHKME